ncbi:MAG: hypothetical protein LZ173_01340 [Thaumarchaeota archaeon]|jgi:hypothetical protein|nr:hypothetical protein [Candidatus Geocrenenecus arthurdayi]
MVNKASIVFAILCLASIILLGIHYISDYFNYKIMLYFSPTLTVSFDNLLRNTIVFIIIMIGWVLTNALLILALYASSKHESGW